MAVNCAPLADRMLFRHLPALNQAGFHKNYGGGDLLSSVQWLNEFRPRLHLRLRLQVQEIERYSPIIRSSSCIKSSNCQAAATVVDDENFGSLLSSPLMIVPPLSQAEEQDDDCNDYFHFFSVAEQKKLKVKKKLGLRWQREYLTPDDAVCIGSTHGWLVFLDPRNCNLYLFNPLQQNTSSSFHDLPYIPLPSLETQDIRRGLRALKSDNLSPSPSLMREELFGNGIRKPLDGKSYPERVVDNHKIRDLVLSSSPSSLHNDNSAAVTVVMNYQGDLYFCKLGVDERWARLPTDLWRNCCDVIYFSKDGRFYVLGDLKFDQLEAWDLTDHSSPKHTLIDPTFSSSGQRAIQEMFDYIKSNMGYSWCVKYLVESSGELLLVSRFFEISESSHHKQSFQRTFRFVVHKLNFNLNKWEPVECLNGRALFVGYNHSYSLSTHDYPGLMENSIYFTENSEELRLKTNKGHDNGIFHLEDKSLTFYCTRDWKRIEPYSVRVPSSVWVCSAQNDALQ